MAYACPVCETLVPDGEHLAHHLAIVALTRGGEHEAWLDETIEGWADRDPAALAAAALEHADRVDHELVDDAPTDGVHTDQPPVDGSTAPRTTPPALGDDAAAVLQEARAMTAELTSERDDGCAASDGDAAEDDDPDASAETDSDE